MSTRTTSSVTLNVRTTGDDNEIIGNAPVEATVIIDDRFTTLKFPDPGDGRKCELTLPTASLCRFAELAHVLRRT